MTLEEWKSLQDEFGFKIFGICYENMSFEEGVNYLKTLSDNFEDIYNDEKEKNNGRK